MGFLLDTNILSEVRKNERCDRQVWQWYGSTQADELYTSVLVLGELRRGIEKLRPKDPRTAVVLQKFLHETTTQYATRVLPITIEVTDIWGRFSGNEPLPIIDGLLAATALHHGLTLVTRNTRDVARSGALCLNPFI